MKAFKYYNAQDLKDAVAVLSKPGDSRVLAGGTDILGDMKTRNAAPERLVNLKSVQGLDSISPGSSGLRLGALARLSDIAANATIKAKYTGLAEAAGSVGSPQLRNMGTLGGNLCQRPRCWYYRGPEYNCVRKGGGVCFAVSGRNKYHCILNGGPCFIVHPSDVAPMLMALGASVTIASAKGTREVKLDDFFVLPETDPTVETVLQKGEVLTGVTVPAPAAGQKSHYLKFKERESRDFALVGAAVVLDMEGHTVR
ncbi:FAD binding domain-containing protein, partial [bacterium]|nr:FAD binding domain-containing protein [bacterium]